MLLKLDMASKMPIYLQIRNQIVLGIASGELDEAFNEVSAGRAFLCTEWE